MKVKGFDKVIIQHLGNLYEAVNEDSKTVRPVHRVLLRTPDMNEEAIASYARDMLSPLLKALEVKDPVGYTTMGFAAYGEEVGGHFALTVPGTDAIILQVEKRERVLPGISVRNKVAERMAALQAKEVEGWTPTRKDWAQLKDDVEGEMLKTAPIRPSRINVMIDAPYVYIFTSSAKVAEDIGALLRTALGTWPVLPLLNGMEFLIRQALDRIVRRSVDGVEGEQFIHLKHDDGEDVKMKDIDVAADQVVLEYLNQHYTARALDVKITDALTPSGIGNLYFRLTDKGIISALQIGEADVDANYDAVMHHYQNDSGSFLTMMANLFQLQKSLRPLIRVLDKHLGLTPEFVSELDDDEEV